MTTLRLILGDQLSPSLSSLSDCDKAADKLLMCEVWDEATYVKHHKKKIAFVFSAMRHFADSLQAEGFALSYTKLDDGENAGSFKGEVARMIAAHAITKLVVTSPGEYRLLADMQGWQDELGIEVEIRPDDRFLCSPEDFASWADGRKQLRMEYFYRDMRRRYRVLLEGDEPVGGKWNYDAENRKPPSKGWMCQPPIVWPLTPSQARCWRWWKAASAITLAILNRFTLGSRASTRSTR